jgi:hypothetical protein
MNQVAAPIRSVRPFNGCLPKISDPPWMTGIGRTETVSRRTEVDPHQPLVFPGADVQRDAGAAVWQQRAKRPFGGAALHRVLGPPRQLMI